MTPRIQKAIDIFLDALNNGTLAKGACSACACGNLVATAMGIKAFAPHNDEEHRLSFKQPNIAWMRGIHRGDGWQSLFSREQANAQIESTGFTPDEFEQIERAFERNTQIPGWFYDKHSPEKIRADQIAGLTAVIEVMMTFEEQSDNVTEVFTARAEALVLS